MWVISKRSKSLILQIWIPNKLVNLESTQAMMLNLLVIPAMREKTPISMMKVQ